MTDTQQAIWDRYAESWSAISDQQRQSAFTEALDENVVYTDPQMVARGHEELREYMEQFQQNVPGGWFEITYFMTHHNQSIAKWLMKSGEGETLGEGISHAEYNDSGKLTRMTGFFES